MYRYVYIYIYVCVYIYIHILCTPFIVITIDTFIYIYMHIKLQIVQMIRHERDVNQSPWGFQANQKEFNQRPELVDDQRSIVDQHLQQSPSIWCSGFSHHPEVQKKKKEIYELQYEVSAIRVCPVGPLLPSHPGQGDLVKFPSLVGMVSICLHPLVLLVFYRKKIHDVQLVVDQYMYCLCIYNGIYIYITFHCIALHYITLHYIHVYTCMYIYMYTHIHVHICIINMCIYIYVFMCIYIYVYIYIC